MLNFNTNLGDPSFWRPTSVRYLASLLSSIFLVVLVVLLAVDAIFLSDIIVSLVLPELLALDARAFTIFKVILFAIPGGLYIALPTAILIGVYLVLLRRREDQEFIVSAGFGYNLKPLFLLCLFVGLCGAGVSIILSGFVEPHSRFQFRVTIADAAHKAVKDGNLKAGRFYTVDDVTLYAASGRLTNVAEKVFVHQKLPGDINRVTFARKTQNPRANKNGNIGLIFNDAHMYEFGEPDFAQGQTQQKENCAGCGDGDERPAPTYLFFNNFYSVVSPAKFSVPAERTGLTETTLFELFSKQASNDKVVHAIGERSLRAFLCIFAPFLALVAVSVTNRTTLFFAMPAAAGFILVLSFLNSSLINSLSNLGLLVTGFSILTIFVCLVAFCIFLTQKLRNNLTRSIGLTL